MGNWRDHLTAQRMTSGGKRKPRNARASVMDGALGSGVGGSAAPTHSRAAAQRNGTVAAWRYLSRAVDGAGQTVDFLLSATRDKRAAKRFFRRALGRANTCNPRVVVTDRLKSYPGALRELKRAGELRRFAQIGRAHV